MGQRYLRHVFRVDCTLISGSRCTCFLLLWVATEEVQCPEEVWDDRPFWKQVVLVQECPRDDAHVHPDTKEVTEAAILSLGGTDLLPRPALHFLCHHVELVNGGDVPLTLGLWLLDHAVLSKWTRDRLTTMVCLCCWANHSPVKKLQRIKARFVVLVYCAGLPLLAMNGVKLT